ncbi:MAG: methyltransferase [Candidatus Paceibacterota bacterium]|jgi:protein-S-isoprenylcysteine O-methyltransferase Ste14
MNENPKEENTYKNKIHIVFLHSYFWFFVFFLVGVFLNILYPIKIFHSQVFSPLGFFVIILASLLVLWAQRSSRRLDKKNITKETFCNGPYKYTRHPTQTGLFLLLLGFGIMTNSLYMIIVTVLYYFFAREKFLKEEDKILEAKYGEPFREYKKTIKF